jgi:hypothetical protein
MNADSPSAFKYLHGFMLHTTLPSHELEVLHNLQLARDESTELM